MQILEFTPLFKVVVGKLSHLSDWWIVRRYGKYFTGHRNKKRNYRCNPVTQEEKKTQERMRRIVPAYRALRQSPEDWAKLQAEFLAQRNDKHGIHSNVYAYFVHREMARMTREGDLAANPTQFLCDWSQKKRR